MTCKRNTAGFTLIELIVVLALCTLLATLAWSSTRSLHALVMRTELAKLHTICHYLQQVAILTNTVQTLTFHPHTRSYAYGNTHEYCAGTITFGTAPGTLGPPSDAKNPVTNPITFTANQIEFHPSGSIKAGTAYLVDRSTGHTCALSCPISHVSYIRMYECRGGAWRLIS